jgi:hypothetical protein
MQSKLATSSHAPVKESRVFHIYDNGVSSPSEHETQYNIKEESRLCEIDSVSICVGSMRLTKFILQDIGLSCIIALTEHFVW